ncbi:unnamed protein product [Haemonchus placei]|uniref:riboflavin kinase n=1 Tax=Haemonchus placei TaxID=6290 RepID=A0A158QLD7_HAEPC|nr:unnamed protein product [Haemonchus placei]
MVSSEKGGRSSLAILITLILAGMETTADSYVLFTLIETCIEWLKGIVPSPHCRDDLIEHIIPTLSKETSLTISLVSLIAVAFKHLAEESKQLKLLVNFLYQLLELYAFNEWIVHDAVDCALLQIATTMGLSVSEFLHTHGSYIVHRVAISAQSRSDRNRAPVVFRALLDKVDDSRLYSSVRHIIEDLLFALDKFQQDFCILVMRSMLSFVMAIGRWFPDMKPVEMAESCTIENGNEEILETERKALPPPIADVERVLLRTKHLMSSSHLPIRLLAMRVLHEGLYVLRNFDDALLPMVHQNWETLINRFSDKDLEVHQEAMKVVIQMVNVSKSFVYRRVRHQLWPILETWLTHDLHRYTTGTLTYKRRLLIIRRYFWFIMDCERHLPLFVQGRVVTGFGRGGKQLGCPTANLEEAVVQALPADLPCGVFYGLARIKGKQVVQMVASVGWNPHYQNERKTLEVHLLEKYDHDFYGSMIEVLLMGYIRSMSAYVNLEALRDAIKSDILFAQQALANVDTAYYVSQYFREDS